MLKWLIENLGTIIVAIIVLSVVVFAVICIIKDKKNGKSPCGCSCSHCALKGRCHSSRSSCPNGKEL